MHEPHSGAGFSAARATATFFGVLSGWGGILHGIGEVLQGNVAPAGFFIPSWTQGPIAEHMGGDPGLTVVPNLLLTGVLTLAVSAAVVLWSLVGVQRRHGARNLVLLCVAMLLVGGGVGPPVVGMLAGLGAFAIRAPLTGWRRRLPAAARRVLAALWPWVFAIAALNGLFLFVGALPLVWLSDAFQADVFLDSFYFAVVSLLLTLLSGVAYDLERRERAVPA